MKDVTVRQLEMANRVVGFFEANPIDFRKGSPAANLIEEFKQQVVEIQRLTATQASEIAQARAYSSARGMARASLNKVVGRINRTAQALAIRVPELEARLQITRRVGDAKLETQARSLVEIARPFVNEFVDFEMEPQFLTELESRIKAFAQAVTDHKAGRSAHVATSQMIDAAMKHARTILAQLDPIMENKLEENSALQLKWKIVRRVERRWIYQTPKEVTSLSPAA